MRLFTVRLALLILYPLTFIWCLMWEGLGFFTCGGVEDLNEAWRESWRTGELV